MCMLVHVWLGHIAVVGWGGVVQGGSDSEDSLRGIRMIIVDIFPGLLGDILC